MDWFVSIKEYFDIGLWDITRVKNAVVKGKITEAQYEEITGQSYIT